MRKIQVAIYYNGKRGFIILPFGVMKNGPRIIIGPAIKRSVEASQKEIGKAVIQCLKVSEKSIPLDRTEFNKDLVLEASGLGSHSRFNKIYYYLCCEKRENGLYLIDSVNNVEVFLENEEAESLGSSICKLLSKSTDLDNVQECVFTTVNESNLSYTRPSDDFEDIGDGHTDAYQIYTYENNDNNHIAFLIDNGYDDFTEPAIKLRWEQIYGTLCEFDFQAVSDLPVKIRVSGKTKSTMICSEIYQDGDGEMEILYKIDLLNTSVKEKNRIEKEFKKIIASVKIS